MAFIDEEVTAWRQVDLHDPEMKKCSSVPGASVRTSPSAALTVHASRKMQSVGFRSEFSGKQTERKSSTFSGHVGARPWKTRGYHANSSTGHGYPYQVWPNSSARRRQKIMGKLLASSELPVLPFQGHIYAAQGWTFLFVVGPSLRLCACSDLQLLPAVCQTWHYKQALQSSPPHKDFQVYKSLLHLFFYPIYSGIIHM